MHHLHARHHHTAKTHHHDVHVSTALRKLGRETKHFAADAARVPSKIFHAVEEGERRLMTPFVIAGALALFIVMSR